MNEAQDNGKKYIPKKVDKNKIYLPLISLYSPPEAHVKLSEGFERWMKEVSDAINSLTKKEGEE